MTVYFMGTEVQDFPYNSVPTGMWNNTDTWRFNTANVRSTCYLPSGAAETNYIETGTFSATEFWTHAVMHIDYIAGTGTNYFMGFCAGGTVRIGIRFGSGGFTLHYWSGSAWVSFASVAMTSEGLFRFDVYIKVGSPGQVRLYINNIPVASSTVIDTTFGGAVSAFNTVRFCPVGVTTNAITHVSEVIVADWNTIGARVVSRAPNGAGSWNDWTGSGYLAVDEVNLASDFLLSGTANQRFSASFADFPAPGTGESIEGVKIAAAAIRDAGGPQNLNFFTRIGGTDHDFSDQSAPAVQLTSSPNSQFMAINPATAAPWVLADLNAAEFGVRSRS